MAKDKKTPVVSPHKMSPPLRIVESDGDAGVPSPTPEEDSLFQNEITRKVRNPLVDGATPETPPPLPAAATPGTAGKPSPSALSTRRLAIVGVAVFCAVFGVAGLWEMMRKPVKNTSAAKGADTPAPAPSPAPLEATLPAAPPGGTVQIEISVQPADAILLVDGTAAGGNRVKTEVPRDQGRHVVEASAPGHEPFKKTVSFSTDVYLDIELKRRPVPVSGKAKARAPKLKSEARSPQEKVGEDFGMHLERPATRRPASKIDEKDPYAP